MCRRNVEQNNLVRTRRRMPMRQLRWITSVDDVHELNALDDAARAHVQAGDNSFR
jgi:hypothetical protein